MRASTPPSNHLDAKRKKSQGFVVRELFRNSVVYQFEPVLGTNSRLGSKVNANANASGSANGNGTTVAANRSASIVSASFLVRSPTSARLFEDQEQQQLELQFQELLGRPSPSRPGGTGLALSPRLAAMIAQHHAQNTPGSLRSTAPSRNSPPKPKSPSASPRSNLKPQPPIGLSSRTDLDILRYCQSSDQRMGIRPLLEQKKEEQAAQEWRRNNLKKNKSPLAASSSRLSPGPSASKSASQEPAINKSPSRLNNSSGASSVSSDGHERRHPEPTSAVIMDKSLRSGGVSSKSRVKQDKSLQEAKERHDKENCSPTESCSSTCVSDAEKIAKTRQQAFNMEETALTLMKHHPNPESVNYAVQFPLENHERAHLVFMDDRKEPKTKHFTHHQQKQTQELNRPQQQQLAPMEHQVYYKSLWKEQQGFDSHEKKLNVVLSSENEVSIWIEECEPIPPVSSDSDSQETTVVAPLVVQISKDEIDLSRNICPTHLEVPSSRWAQWLCTRLRFDSSTRVFSLDLDRDNKSRSCVFDELVTGTNVKIFVNWNGGGTIQVVCDGKKKLLILKQKEMERLLQLHPGTPVFAPALRDKLVNSGLLSLAKKVGEEEFQPDASLSRKRSNQTLAGAEEATAPTTVGAVSCVVQLDEKPAVAPTHNPVVEISTLAHRFATDTTQAALMHLVREEVALSYAKAYLTGALDDLKTSNDGLAQVLGTFEAAQHRLKTRAAILAIIDDLAQEIIAYECRIELHHVKTSGGFDNLFATKVQSVYRMSLERKKYLKLKANRASAAKLLQTCHRGFLARKRFIDMKIQREKYLYYGFRSSLYQTISFSDNPQQRAIDMAKEKEKRRMTFLMQVIHGYVVQQGLPVPFYLDIDTVQRLLNEYGIVVGCSSAIGNEVALLLRKVPAPNGGGINATAGDESSTQLISNNKSLWSTLGSSKNLNAATSKLKAVGPFSGPQIKSAILMALKGIYDDTFGLSASARRYESLKIKAANKLKSPSSHETKPATQGQPQSTSDNRRSSSSSAPPRWLLKESSTFHQTNRERLTRLRFAKKEAGQQAAHLVTKDFRFLLLECYQNFEACRDYWEEHLRKRAEESLTRSCYTLDQLVGTALTILIQCVKDWGIDPDPLFEALNLCLVHHHGRQAIRSVQQQFNEFARGINQLHNKLDIYPLEEEIMQELDDFERLIAIRCLSFGQDLTATVSPSEVLYLVLKGNIDEEFVRYALPTILPVANVTEKYDLAKKVLLGYANSSYGDAFNSICWSCLDAAEHVTVQASLLLSRMAQPDVDAPNGQSILYHALYVLVGSQCIQLLHFVAKASHFSPSLQATVLDVLDPLAHQYEMYRLARVAIAMQDFAAVNALFAKFLDRTVLHNNEAFWQEYSKQFGEHQAQQAQLSMQVRQSSQRMGRFSQITSAMKPSEDVSNTSHTLPCETKDKQPASRTASASHKRPSV